MPTPQPLPVHVIPLVESVYTLQGEGAFQGHAAYFIRLGGCDVGCPWCDTKHSWNAADHPKTSIQNIVKGARATGSPLAVITGGEPTLHDLSELTASLQQAGLRTHLETAGVYPITGQWNWISFSPKKFKNPLPSVYTQAHELKMVIYHISDFEWAEQQASKVGSHCALYLQSEYSKQEKITPLIIQYVKKNPRWKISLQIHKYLHIA